MTRVKYCIFSILLKTSAAYGMSDKAAFQQIVYGN